MDVAMSEEDVEVRIMSPRRIPFQYFFVVVLLFI
jgi:hypothetical protein